MTPHPAFLLKRKSQQKTKGVCFLDPFNFSICIHNIKSVEEYGCGISAPILYHLLNYHGTSSCSFDIRAPWHPLCYFPTFKVLWFHFFWGWSSFPCEAFPLTTHIYGSVPMKKITVMLHFLPYYSFLQQIHSLLTFMLPVLSLPNFLHKVLPSSIKISQ